MHWYPTLVLWMAFIDAGFVILFGLVAAIMHLFKWDFSAVWDRVMPALGAIVGSTIAAALILGAARWVTGQ